MISKYKVIRNAKRTMILVSLLILAFSRSFGSGIIIQSNQAVNNHKQNDATGSIKSNTQKEHDSQQPSAISGKKHFDLKYLYADSILFIGKQLGDLNLQLKAWIEYFKIDSAMKNFNKALNDAKQIDLLQDSILSNERRIAFSRLELNYYKERKDKEDKLLLARIAKENAKEKQLHIYIAIGIAILVLTIIVFIFLWRQRNKVNESNLRQLMLENNLETLMNEINPHFYFNTLNNIHALIDIDKEKAKSALELLSQMMRYHIYDCNQQLVDLSKELEDISNYLELQRLRYSDMTKISLNIEGDTEDKQIAPFILLAFVEFAFKNGLQSINEKSFLTIVTSISDHELKFQLDSTASMSKKSEALSEGNFDLTNVTKRLELMYPKQYTLSMDTLNSIFSLQLSLKI